MRLPHPLLIIAFVGALIGFCFASVSTFDFAQHLDRQVHGLHCSFIPGLAEAETAGSDCAVTLMSPYSSVMRDTIWGGIPISLPAMGVFAFFLFFCIDILLSRRQTDRRSTGFLALGSLVPAVTSGVMAAISLGELDAACKLCIGIYTGSTLLLLGSVGLWIRALKTPTVATKLFADDSLEGDAAASAELDAFTPPAHASKPGAPASWPFLIGAFFLGVVFVFVPVIAYYVSVPDHSNYIGECGVLEEMPDAELLIPVGPQGGSPALEIFDPLCPACRGFEEHLETTRFHDELSRKAVLFPLDSECNWMLNDPVHHGACTVSEAIICAEGDADEVIQWAFDNQEAIRDAAKADSAAAARMVSQQFPHLSKCVGSPKAKQKLNRSLRWAVDANLRILTPQLYVKGKRLCDEDVDLGLEFALSRMLGER